MYYVLDVVFTVCILHISHLSLALSLSHLLIQKKRQSGQQFYFVELVMVNDRRQVYFT